MKLLMVAHSYVVALNRRLCREVARVGGDDVAVTVAAPRFFHGDLRPIALECPDGEPYELVPVTARLSRIPHVFTYGRELASLMKRPGWDVVHAWEEPYILAGGQIAARCPRDASLVSSTFQNIPKLKPPPFEWIERAAMNRSDGWTAFGRTIAEAQRHRPGYRDRPMREIPLGVDLDVFRFDEAAGRAVRAGLGWSEPGPPVIGYLGRFVPEKGLGLLMNALDRLPSGSWRALVVGGGAMERDLRDWAARHDDRARVVTGVAHDAVPPYLNAMDLMAAPSQTTRRWKEQLGRMLLEAMASGVPVVASDSGEIPFVVGEAGRVVPEADEDTWVSALGELVEDSSARDRFARSGLDRVREVYTWPVIARRFLDFFREIREARIRA